MLTDNGITLTNKEARNIARILKAKHPDLKGVDRSHIHTVVALLNKHLEEKSLGEHVDG